LIKSSIRISLIRSCKFAISQQRLALQTVFPSTRADNDSRLCYINISLSHALITNHKPHSKKWPSYHTLNIPPWRNGFMSQLRLFSRLIFCFSNYYFFSSSNSIRIPPCSWCWCSEIGTGYKKSMAWKEEGSALVYDRGAASPCIAKRFLLFRNLSNGEMGCYRITMGWDERNLSGE